MINYSSKHKKSSISRREYTEAYEQGYTDGLKELLEIAEEIDDTYMIEVIKRKLGYDR